MLAIAYSGHEVRYFRWENDGDDVRLIACQVIPWAQEVDAFNNVASIRDMTQRIIGETNNGDPASIYITIDANFCNFTMMEIDPNWDTTEQLVFAKHNRFGNTAFYDAFQYPLNIELGQYLNVDCPVVLRRAVLSALPRTGRRFQRLSIGVFSAFNYAQRVVPGMAHGRWLFWRCSKDNVDQFLEINESVFQAVHLVSSNADGTHKIKTIGVSTLQEGLMSFIDQLENGQDADFPEVEKVFVYHGSGDTDFLQGIFNREQSSLSLMNPFWRWNWPKVPEADNPITQSAFTELADAIWMTRHG